jgi:triphosphatase
MSTLPDALSGYRGPINQGATTSTLRHITANETAVQRSDSEGVHQMRVGLRRLRAAISLFSKLFGDKQTERIKSELHWLRRGELSPARDLDVYERRHTSSLRTMASRRRCRTAIAERRAAARLAQLSQGGFQPAP